MKHEFKTNLKIEDTDGMDHIVDTVAVTVEFDPEDGNEYGGPGGTVISVVSEKEGEIYNAKDAGFVELCEIVMNHYNKYEDNWSIETDESPAYTWGNDGVADYYI